MTTAREHVLAHLSERGAARTQEIAEEFEGPIGTIYGTLSDLTRTGEIERVSTGVYRLAGDDSTPPAKPAKRRFSEPPIATTDPDRLEVAVLSDGSAVIWRGDVRLQLSALEVARIGVFLRKVAE